MGASSDTNNRDNFFLKPSGLHTSRSGFERAEDHTYEGSLVDHYDVVASPRPEYPPEPTRRSHEEGDHDPHGRSRVTMITEDAFPYATTTESHYAKEDTETMQVPYEFPAAGPDTDSSGEEGPTDCDCQPGEPGFAGFAGPKGYKGTKGVRGRGGDAGPVGDVGPEGDDGASGFSGAMGPRGDAGPPGPKGGKGSKGSGGDKGKEGPQGRDGQKGQTGAPGFPGDVGDRGYMGYPGQPGGFGPGGPKGSEGHGGLPGSDGDPGEDGPIGVPGLMGEPGEFGVKGSKGDRGVAGPRGRVGAVGAKGETGPDGDKGAAGRKGVKGGKGQTVIVLVYSRMITSRFCFPHSSLPLSTPAGIYSPRGPKGAVGRDGVPGPVGSPGIPGTRGERGPVGEAGVKGRAGAKGVPGPSGPGLSDQQVLQLCRGVVTAQISQYASSIRAKCSQGCPINNRTLIGPPGVRGQMGSPGKPGKAGKAGAKGARGVQGDRGLEGQKGEQGDRAQKGPKGAAGDPGKGLPGPDGPQGLTGLPGHPAEPKNGMEGPRGPRGFPGQSDLSIFITFISIFSTMFPHHLSLCVLLLLPPPGVRLSVEAAAIEEELVIKSVSGMDCVLQCTAVYKDGVQYGAVRWYKVQESLSPGLSGLVTRNLSSGETKYYVGLDRELQLLAGSRNIFMPNVTCDDAGVYECHLAAPVGEQNREGRVLLTVTAQSKERPPRQKKHEFGLVPEKAGRKGHDDLHFREARVCLTHHPEDSSVTTRSARVVSRHCFAVMT
ncbi:hypothetical protein F2P81_016609 [Scophthalmus maximus]|uniref:Ig-like domain-containing protein n=1 Tax=Scophthalmus maximus TaxID=52904 RepID=A0A6A4SLW3_SCOMX|nr:hypothetical protein F2P81_016609 [Scophthalmus maximus]